VEAGSFHKSQIFNKNSAVSGASGPKGGPRGLGGWDPRSGVVARKAPPRRKGSRAPSPFGLRPCHRRAQYRPIFPTSISQMGPPSAVFWCRLFLGPDSPTGFVPNPCELVAPGLARGWRAGAMTRGGAQGFQRGFGSHLGFLTLAVLAAAAAVCLFGFARCWAVNGPGDPPSVARAICFLSRVVHFATDCLFCGLTILDAGGLELGPRAVRESRHIGVVRPARPTPVARVGDIPSGFRPRPSDTTLTRTLFSWARRSNAAPTAGEHRDFPAGPRVLPSPSKNAGFVDTYSRRQPPKALS